LFINSNKPQPIIFDREYLTLGGIDFLSKMLKRNREMNVFLKGS
jgi:hypothetical protein